MAKVSLRGNNYCFYAERSLISKQPATAVRFVYLQIYPYCVLQ
jgi:hypothetical protein